VAGISAQTPPGVAPAPAPGAQPPVDSAATAKPPEGQPGAKSAMPDTVTDPETGIVLKRQADGSYKPAPENVLQPLTPEELAKLPPAEPSTGLPPLKEIHSTPPPTPNQTPNKAATPLTTEGEAGARVKPAAPPASAPAPAAKPLTPLEVIDAKRESYERGMSQQAMLKIEKKQPLNGLDAARAVKYQNVDLEKAGYVKQDDGYVMKTGETTPAAPAAPVEPAPSSTPAPTPAAQPTAAEPAPQPVAENKPDAITAKIEDLEHFA